MSRRHFQQLRDAFVRLHPEHIRQAAGRKPRLLVVAASSASYAAMEDYLAPATLSRDKRTQVIAALSRACDAGSGGSYDLVLFEAGCSIPAGWEPGENAFLFDPHNPREVVERVAGQHEDLSLALARLFAPFRRAVVRRTIHAVARDNALFSLMTALPNVIPSFAELPWAVGEFSSDTVVLTANQIRMAFLLAAASDRAVGFHEQRSEIGALVAGAFGWRTLARELSGKIPFGGGLVPKAAIAYAGTFVAGVSIERIYRLGYGLTREERERLFDQTITRGRDVASALLDRVRQR